MKYPVLVWWLALAVCVHSVVLSKATSTETNVENSNTTWIFVPDENGNPYVVYLNESPASGDTRNERIVIPVELYSRNNRFRDSGIKTNFFLVNESIFYDEKATLYLINEFDAQLDTKMLVHGWKSTKDSFKCIRSAYIKRGNFNIFEIDWSLGADAWWYSTSAKEVDDVGQVVADLIMLLVEKKGADSKRIHLIGHSLGAHVMGYAGYYFNDITGKTVGRITGLDPASPFFEAGTNLGPGKHLKATDADFVDVIHTDARPFSIHFGFEKPIGHVDFYPNGESRMQPGCNIIRPNIGKLFHDYFEDLMDFSLHVTGKSHSRAYELYAESINSKRGFYSARCSGLKTTLAGKCSGPQILMGDRVPVEARGIYYLKTNKKAPFAKGKHA